MRGAQVQLIIAEYFRKRGYNVQENTIFSNVEVDVVAQKDSERWIIEVKGDYDRKVEQYTVNFDTGMGQILKSASEVNENTKYGICIPFSRTERGERLSYRLILPKYVKSMVFEMLNLHLIIVRDDKSVEIITPINVRAFLSRIDTTIRKDG
jgi:hypothetical protein